MVKQGMIRILFAFALTFSQTALGQSLADVFDGRAVFVRDNTNTGFGSSFGMHFIADVRDTSAATNYVYYINGYYGQS